MSQHVLRLLVGAADAPSAYSSQDSDRTLGTTVPRHGPVTRINLA